MDRVGQTLKEDFVGKLAGLISPYLDQVVRRCTEAEQRQTTLEEKFKEHEKVVRGSAGELEAAFVKMRKEAAKDWQAQRAMIQQDYAKVNDFVKWLQERLEEGADTVQGHQEILEKFEELVNKVDVPVDETVKALNEIKSQGVQAIDEASQHLKKTYQNLRQPILSQVRWALAAAAMIILLMAGFSIWSMHLQANRSEQAIAEYTEKQKEEVRGLLDKTLEEAKETQIANEIKMKMWDAFLNSLTPQQQTAVIGKFREQVNEAERKRIGDQMSASYDQMNRKKK
jgi:hypothetical protein